MVHNIYKLSDEDKAKLTYYGRSLFEMKAASDIVYPYSKNPMYLDYQADFKTPFVSMDGENGTPQNRPIEALSKKSTTAENFFYGYETYYKKIWDKYRNYFK